MDSEKRDKTVINCAVSDEAAQCDKISYFIFESVQARNERTIKRLWISTIILVILLFVSNALWLYEFTRYDYETYSVDMDAGETGDALYNYIGEDGRDSAEIMLKVDDLISTLSEINPRLYRCFMRRLKEE